MSIKTRFLNFTTGLSNFFQNWVTSKFLPILMIGGLILGYGLFETARQYFAGEEKYADLDCLEYEYSSMGSTCIEYSDTEYLSYSDSFKQSFSTAAYFVLGFSILSILVETVLFIKGYIEYSREFSD